MVYFVPAGVPRLKAIGAILPAARSSPNSAADCAVSLMSSMGHVEPSLGGLPTQPRLPYAGYWIISNHPHSFSMRRNLDT